MLTPMSRAMMSNGPFYFILLKAIRIEETALDSASFCTIYLHYSLNQVVFHTAASKFNTSLVLAMPVLLPVPTCHNLAHVC